MRVDINKTRNDQSAGGVENRVRIRHGNAWLDGRNSATLDGNIHDTVETTRRVDHTATNDD